MIVSAVHLLRCDFSFSPALLSSNLIEWHNAIPTIDINLIGKYQLEYMAIVCIYSLRIIVFN